MSDQDARAEAHDEAMRRYGPVPDYTTLPYEQVVAFERGALWQRSRPVSEPSEEADKLEQLIRDLIDEDDCWFDHNGGCQAHGYLDLKPGELCPQAEAKQWLAARAALKAAAGVQGSGNSGENPEANRG